MDDVKRDAGGQDVDVSELLQEDPRNIAIDPIPVEVAGVVRTVPMPARSSAYQTFPVDGSAKRLLLADPRRKSAQLVAADQDPFYAGTREELEGVVSGSSHPSAAQWPRGVVLTVTHQGEVWAATGDGTTTIVGVLAEFWTE